MITAEVFQAHLKCPTKAHLIFEGSMEPCPEFSDGRRRQIERVKTGYIEKIDHDFGQSRSVPGPSTFADLICRDDWTIATDCLVETTEVKSRLDAIERIREQIPNVTADVYIPIRFTSHERLTKDDRLLLAFDALCLARVSGRAPTYGKIIHGGDLKTTKVKLAGVIEEAERILSTLAASIGSELPDLVLNKHCSECEFQSQCRALAITKDDLSLLSSMSEQERRLYRGKGIFTITQLSYTFRPRRRPKRLVSLPEPYHHALRALAIREGKIHLAGEPKMRRQGTAVYLDVEGTDEFYYLIGARIHEADSLPQHYSFWADCPTDEARIWTDFLTLLTQLDSPQLIYYGSYETVFLKRMKQWYGGDSAVSKQIDTLLASAINLVTVAYAIIYFPTFSNGLKDVATYLGYRWSSPNASGARSILWRQEWEASKDIDVKSRLTVYNAEDCEALEIVMNAVARLCQQAGAPDLASTSVSGSETINAISASKHRGNTFGHRQYALPELESINKAAYWNYQRERITVRNGNRKPARPRIVYATPVDRLPINKTILCAPPTKCPYCGSDQLTKTARHSKVVYDLKFITGGVKRWIVKYVFDRFRCMVCALSFCSEEKTWTRHKFGTELLAYIIYHVIELKLAQSMVARQLGDICGCTLRATNIKQQKTRAAAYYAETYQAILEDLLNGDVIYVDETKVNVKGVHGYVWILCSAEAVGYFHTESREGERIQELLRDYRGVLVSDFYAIYDSVDCAQQKCLIHLMRDLNDALLKEPYNREVKDLVAQFADVLKPIVETIDRFGLKARHLRKHKKAVERFLGAVERAAINTEAALKIKQRFMKNREKLFTFLDHDNVAWNNNNAEHAVKAFAAIRDQVRGSSTKTGLDEYLTLLSINQTCVYRDVSFLEFLRSGTKDLNEFTRRSRRRRRSSSRDLPREWQV